MTEKIVVVLMILLLSSVPVMAQPGGGGGGTAPGGGGGTAPGGGGAGGAGGSVGGGAVGAAVGDAAGLDVEGIIQAVLGNVAVGDDWSALDLTDQIPTSEEDIMALLEESGLPIDSEGFDVEGMLDSMDIGNVSDEAYAAIAGFAQTYLGMSGVDLIFAGDITDEMVSEAQDAADTTASQSGQELPIDMILEQLPEEAQAMIALASVSGTGYWGIMSDGATVVYTNLTCDDDNCTVSMENVQIVVTSGSLGAFARYSETAVGSSADARSLISTLYPALGNKNLEEQTASSGYAYSVTNLTSSSSVEAYYAGVISAGELSIVYVVGGVGEGYADMVGSG